MKNSSDNSLVKKDSVIIDVGINRIFDKESEQYKFVGDVDYESIFEKVKAITPVPGGIGTITTATLLSNVVKAAIWNNSQLNSNHNKKKKSAKPAEGIYALN